MKTWLSLGGMIILGSVILFGGGEWFTNENPDKDTADAHPKYLPVEEINPESLATPEETATARLELRLPKDQPIPLLKTVEQVLVQKTATGDRKSHSALELTVTLRHKETAADGSRLLNVVYNRVRYRQDVAGKTFIFDSSVPSGQLPVEALPYKGLVGNGFSFWIDTNNRIIKPVGFADFLKRCIREVPPAQQHRVLLAFSDAADEGVANFVDDSLGFLPPNPEVKEEDTWINERRLTKPIPIVMNTHCTLRQLNEHVAQVDIDGEIATTKTFSPQNNAARDVQVTVRGGRSTGRCEIDRATGLPLHSMIKRIVNMEVQMATGEKFDQEKITTTTIRLFPQQSSPTNTGVIHAGGEQPARN